MNGIITTHLHNRKEAFPKKYEYWITEEGLLRLEDWARNGLVDEQIAQNIGIHVATLYDWKKEYPEINDALKKGKEIVDAQVENSLLRRALGYDFDETIVEKSPDGTKVKKNRKHMPPDVTACIFWLKNRRPGKWRDKPMIADTETDYKLDKLLAAIDNVPVVPSVHKENPETVS